MTQRVTLARHAETLWNEQLRYIGRTDLEVSELGRRHAAMMAEYFSDEPLSAVFSSNMKRALETAAIIMTGQDNEIIVEPGLREVDFGSWEGMTFTEITSAYPDLADAWVEDPIAVQIPGGEPLRDFISRVRKAWSATRAAILNKKNAADGGRVVVVTHAGCIKVILGEIMGLSDDALWGIHQEKGALNHIQLSPTETRILDMNDISYKQNK